MERVSTSVARARLAFTAAVAAVAAMAFSLVCVPAAGADAVAAASDGSPTEVRDYWTPARMRAATEVPEPAGSLLAGRPDPASGSSADDATYVPATGAAAVRGGVPKQAKGPLGIGVTREEVTDPAAPEVRMHGKVFFTVPAGPSAGDYVCSGTALNSKNRSVVWTAGHCVYDVGSGADAFATNWNFVPGYSEAGAPYGEWPAKRLATTRGWKTSGNLRYDIGAAVVAKNAQGQRLGEVVGGRGIGFDQPRDLRFAAYGYPALDNPIEFTGDREWRCISESAGADAPVGSGPATMAIDCDMTGGASGGGWISGTTLITVTSYGYAIEPNHLYGPYLSTTAKSLYRSVSGKKKKKKRGGKGGKGGGERRQGRQGLALRRRPRGPQGTTST